jgi:hypothetical protein
VKAEGQPGVKAEGQPGVKAEGQPGVKAEGQPGVKAEGRGAQPFTRAEGVVGGNNGAQRHPAEFFAGAAGEK